MSLCYSFFVSVVITERQPISVNDLRWNVLQAKALEDRVSKAFSLFNSHAISAILIKGWAVARLYPNDNPRVTTDTDIAVSADEFEFAERLVDSTEAHGLAIDLHRELRHLDTIGWDDLIANSQIVDLNGVPVRILRPEDHLRVLCVHWLSDGGAYRDRLWDVVYQVDKRPQDFDWYRCLNAVSQNRRRWILCTLGLAKRFLGLDLDNTPIVNEACKLPPWLIRAVEREWSTDLRLRPLHNSLGDTSVLMPQIKKRLRPNPIQATIEMEGSFDAGTRLHYQVGSLLKRIGPSLRRVSGSIISRAK